MCKPLPKDNFAWNKVLPNGKANPRQKGRSKARIDSRGGFGVSIVSFVMLRRLSTRSREKKIKREWLSDYQKTWWMSWG